MKTYSFYFRHLDKDGYVFNHFLDLVTLEDGTADSIVAAIKNVLQKRELPVDRLCGLETDGAAVMTGMDFWLNLFKFVKFVLFSPKGQFSH